MVIVASIYLKLCIKVSVGTFLLTPSATPPKIPSDSDSIALTDTHTSFEHNHCRHTQAFVPAGNQHIKVLGACSQLITCTAKYYLKCTKTEA
jgi:hypothetical protein